jgi:PAS domain S-box-containing protein
MSKRTPSRRKQSSSVRTKKTSRSRSTSKRTPSRRKRPSPVRTKSSSRSRSTSKPRPLRAKDLETFFNCPLDLLCILDPQGNLCKVNPIWKRLLGQSPDQLVGRHFLEFFHPEDRPRTLAAFEGVCREEKVPDVVNRLRCQDGTYRFLEWRAYRYGPFVYASARDVTDRIEAEEKLTESRRMLETVLDTIPIPVFWKDNQSVYLGCNRSFLQATGFDSPEDVIGHDDRHLVPPEQAAVYRADDREVMESGKAKYQYEMPHREHDGTQRWLRTSKTPLRDMEGNIRGILGTFEDITEQKDAEKALRESEERYHRITRTITDYIYHVRVDDGKAVQTLHGRRCLAVTGYAREEFAADPDLWLRMVDPEDRPLVEDQVRRILSGNASIIEHRLWRKDGKRRWVRHTPVLHFDSRGQLLSYDGLIQDITERKEAELHIRAQHDLALSLNAVTNMEEGLRLCVEAALRVSGMDAGGIYLLENVAGGLELIAHRGLTPELYDEIRHFSADDRQTAIIRQGTPAYFDRKQLQKLAHSSSLIKHFQSLAVIPIHCDGQVIGSLNLASASQTVIPLPIRESLETLVAQSANSIARLRSEAALRENEERYRHLFDLGSDAIFFIENDTGRILEANNAASTLYGYSREELLAMRNVELSDEPEDTQRLTAETPAAPDDVLVIPMRFHRRKDGTVFPVEVTARFFNWLGKPVHIAAVRDITRRRKTEEDLKESRRMLETVLDTIPVRVFWKDRRSVYLGCNRTFLRDAGLMDAKEIIGRDDRQMSWREQAELYRADDRSVMETGKEKLNYEEPQTQADGKHVWVRTSKIPLRDLDGNVRGLLGTYEDITERKLAEEQIRKLNWELEQRVALRTAQLEATNKELEAFSYSISHDLRAPLRAIDGFTRALEEDYAKNLDEEGRRLCGILRRNTRHMYELIDNLLAFSRYSQTELNHISTDMASMVNSVFQELTTPETRARIDFHVGDLPRIVADPILLRQVWTNLVSNAIKFTANRERAKIIVECRCTPEEDVFSISDNGAGFDMHYADRLFGVFQRLHNSAEYEGTGVGLAIVQRIIHRHGGRVWAEGQPERGATFFFGLPKQTGAV